jgi:phospholipid-binding lipoprotein MlaA
MKPSRIILTLLIIIAFSLAGAGCASKQTDTAAGSESSEPQAAATAENMAEESAGAEKPEAEAKTAGQENIAEDDLSFLEGEETELQDYQSIADPLEPFNRAMFWFNDVLYQVIDPVATAYRLIFPEEVRTLFGNFFYNLTMPVRFVSNVLQGDLSDAGLEVGRFVINSTVGFLGFADAASMMEIPKPSDEDLGQTFGAWGIDHGFYLVLPFMGPNSLRDGLGMAGGYFLDPLTYYPDEWELRWGFKGFRVFHEASNILPNYFDLKDSALDPYVAVRDFYSQMRKKAVEEQ